MEGATLPSPGSLEKNRSRASRKSLPSSFSPRVNPVRSAGRLGPADPSPALGAETHTGRGRRTRGTAEPLSASTRVGDDGEEAEREQVATWDVCLPLVCPRTPRQTHTQSRPLTRLRSRIPATSPPRVTSHTAPPRGPCPRVKPALCSLGKQTKALPTRFSDTQQWSTHGRGSPMEFQTQEHG